jgi:ferredoxin
MSNPDAAPRANARPTSRIGFARRVNPPDRIDSTYVKARARALGADLVGIASAATLNAFPPDPRWPQTPEGISPYCKSVIVIANRIPAGAFRAKSNTPVQYMDMLVLRKMDKVAYLIAEELERAGHPSFVTAAQETEWSLKRASYGRLSTRHLGVEAGLGTLGLEVNILTPEFGPRIYLTGILTELELEPDQRITEQVCIGESCSRCLHACPADAVQHWGIDKRNCATEAQEFGFGQILKFFDTMIERPNATATEKMDTFVSRDFFGFWQGLLRVVGSFGDCPRCLAVCPVGNDYHAHLAEPQKVIPEKSPKSIETAKRYKSDRAAHEAGSTSLPGLSDWNRRWVGEDGYQGMVARQLQAFKQLQRDRAAEQSAEQAKGEQS